MAEETKKEDIKEEKVEAKPKEKKVEAKEEKKETKPEAKPAKRAKKKPKRRFVPEGRAYIQASFNNTLITITDPSGEVLCWGSAGSSGFKGPKKATPFAAQTSAEKVAEKAKAYGVERVHIFIKGAGNGRDQSMRGLTSGGIGIESITDVTTIPHNGCRPKKTRRV
jgi:small subunit ribosomal protein S11